MTQNLRSHFLFIYIFYISRETSDKYFQKKKLVCSMHAYLSHI